MLELGAEGCPRKGVVHLCAGVVLPNEAPDKGDTPKRFVRCSPDFEHHSRVLNRTERRKDQERVAESGH